jgi:hypothetical protein
MSIEIEKRDLSLEHTLLAFRNLRDAAVNDELQDRKNMQVAMNVLLNMSFPALTKLLADSAHVNGSSNETAPLDIPLKCPERAAGAMMALCFVLADPEQPTFLSESLSRLCEDVIFNVLQLHR